MTLLPVGQNKTNLNYYRLMPDEELILRHKEATAIWFKLLMSEPYKEFTEGHLETQCFWENNMNNMALILKERNLDPKS